MKNQQAAHGLFFTLMTAALLSAGTAGATSADQCTATVIGTGSIEDCTDDQTVRDLFDAIAKTLDESSPDVSILLDDYDCLINGVTCTTEQQTAASNAIVAWNSDALQFDTATSTTRIAYNPGCFINVGICSSGDCFISVGICTNGDCYINVGICAGRCTINVGICRGFRFDDVDFVKFDTSLL